MKKCFLSLLCCIIGLTPYAQASNVTTPQTHASQTSQTPQNNDLHKPLDTVTPSGQSVLEVQFKVQKQVRDNPFTIILYRPTYILPYYYTASPDYRVYETPQGRPPNHQKIMNNEFKAQLSFMVPIIPKIFHNPNLSLNLAYTQLNYWQVYAHSQYFRETNYEPEIFFENHFHRNWLLQLGLDHQSNGRGGELERSWNRAITTLQLSGDNWLVGLRTWAILTEGQDTPNIGTFLGYESLLLSYKIHDATASIQFQNIESGLRRGSVELTLSYPILKHISLFGQFFSGYGQSLIEYNHRTQAAGVGITFNDWI